jgi:PAS domain S-box-containing protein
MTAVFWREQRHALEQRYLERVRAMSLALDRELEGTILSLELLAQSPYLRSGDLRRFHQQAGGIGASEKPWVNIILNDPASGRQVLNLRKPYGAPLHESTVDRATLENVVNTGQPYIAPLLKGRISGQYMTAVVVPATAEHGRRYALVASIEQSSWLRFLESYPTAPDATMTLLDQNGVIIARTLNNDKWVGQRPPSELAGQSRKSVEGAYRSIGLEGQKFYSAHARSQVAGWTVATGVPEQGAEAVLREWTIVMASGAAGSSILAIALAFMFGSRIARPVSDLARSAQALATGERVDTHASTDVAEVTEVRTAFYEAAERLRAQDSALRESEQRFRTMADTAPVLIWVSEADKQCTYFNKPWLDFTGRTLEQELNDGWEESVHPDDLARCRETYSRACDARERFDMEYRLRRADGEYRWVLDRASPRFSAEGTFLGYIGSAVDITERKHVEESLRQSEARLREADRRKDEYLAMLGHELRNPLGVISMTMQMQRMQPPPASELAELQKIVERQVQHMTRLLDDLLDVSRISRGQLRLDKEVCDFGAVVRESVEDYRSNLEASGLRVEMDIPDRPFPVLGDRTRLAQAVGNMLHNADKFTGAGGTVSIELREDPAGGDVILTVRDTGIGMEKEILERVFEPFTQGNRGIDRSPGGLGLGLALVRGLIELHGGQVRASSAGPGQGSELTVRLPLNGEAAPAAKPLAPRAQSSRCCRVLVIEDNAMGARTLEIFLTRKGHAVEVAHSGREGVEAARRFQPEVILCDIGLPEFDGYKVARQIRQQPGLNRVYIIGVSGYGHEQDKVRAWQAGFNAYLVKPLNMRELETLLANFEQRKA